VVELETEKQLFYCKDCDYQFSVTAGTVFNDSHLSLVKWFTATLLLCEAKKGISALQIKRTLGIGGYKTAWYLCHRIRHAMTETQKGMLDGTVEMDETYVGGVKRGGRGPHASEKEIVIGIRKRSGDLRFFHVKDTKAATLAKYIRENISEDVDVIITDDWVGYPKAMMKAGFRGDRHKTINHSGRVYVMGNIHTNTESGPICSSIPYVIWLQHPFLHSNNSLKRLPHDSKRAYSDDLHVCATKHGN
jgi:transposase-like protein